MEDLKYIYHGSPINSFEIAIPRRNKRSETSSETGEMRVIFDEISFHATPYKWIALAYTYVPKEYKMGDKIAHYNMGVDLYNYKEEIDIFGFDSLEESLDKMYGDGGYIFVFEKEKFSHTEGLGNLEMITKESIKPLRVEKIDDPVSELEKLGIKFNFIDLAKPENEEYRNYVS